MSVDDKQPLLAVDRVTVEIKVGHEHHQTLKTFKIPVADIRFLVDRNDADSDVVAAVRLTNHQLRELLDTLQEKLNEFDSRTR